MKAKKTLLILAAIMALSLTLSPMAALGQDQLIVVATKQTYQAAQRWVDFLTTKGIVPKNVEPSQFGQYKQSEYIAVMGGVDEAGIKELVKEAVGDQELAALSQKGAGKMYVKSNVWGPGQNVVIFAGSDAQAAEKARVDAKDEWMGLFADWFGLEMGGPSLKGY